MPHRRPRRQKTVKQATAAVKRATSALIEHCEYVVHASHWNGYQCREGRVKTGRLRKALGVAVDQLEKLVMPGSDAVRRLMIELRDATDGITSELHRFPRDRKWPGMASLHRQIAALSALATADATTGCQVVVGRDAGPLGSRCGRRTSEFQGAYC